MQKKQFPKQGVDFKYYMIACSSFAELGGKQAVAEHIHSRLYPFGGVVLGGEGCDVRVFIGAKASDDWREELKALTVVQEILPIHTILGSSLEVQAWWGIPGISKQLHLVCPRMG